MWGVFVGIKGHFTFENIDVTMFYFLFIPQDIWQ